MQDSGECANESGCRVFFFSLFGEMTYYYYLCARNSAEYYIYGISLDSYQ